MALGLITESWWVYSPEVSVISETLSIVGIVTGSQYLHNELLLVKQNSWITGKSEVTL